MAEAELLRAIAETRLRHRLFEAEGRLGYLFQGDREAVEIDRGLWQSVSAEHDAAIAIASRRLKWMLLLTIPVIIATLVVITNVPLLTDLTDRIDRIPFLGAALVLVIVSWLPLAGLLLHARATARARERLESRLVDLPRIAPPSPRPRLHQELQILVMLLVGPAILIRAFGTLVPDAYRNTPLSGTHLGRIDLVAALALVAWLATRRRTE